MLGRILTRIKNKRGSIAVPLILSAIGLPIVLFSGYFALQFKSKQVETDEFIIFKESIHSVLKFTLFGVERKWCFSDRWSFNTKCDSLNDDKSTERILFGETELASLRKFKQDNPDAVCGTCTEENCKKCLNLPSNLSNIKLKKFSETFTSEKLKDNKQFALSRYFATYASDSSSQIKINSLTLTVSRSTEGHQVRGNEKYVKIEAVASFTERGEAKTYKVDWTLSLFPRELNMFSLILAKDMYFYKTTAASEAPADQNADKCIPSESESTSFASITQAQKSSHKGFVFQSPVFVNGNLHFKTPSDSSSDKFTPVYFMDRLYLGKGELLYDSNTPFTPKKAGKLMNHENLNIGSLKGVLLEDSDKGLEVFSGQEACESRDDALAECLEAAADGKINYVVDKSEIEIETSLGKINAGTERNCAIKDGALYCWGRNNVGQLGDGTEDDRSVPTPVLTMGSGVTEVSTRYSHTCAIKDEALYCWGWNISGQLGGGTITSYLVSNPNPNPVLTMDSDVTQVSAGGAHTCAIKDGELYCWGSTRQGQLGHDDGTTGDKPTPTQVKNMTSGVTQVSAGGAHTCAIQSGKLFCWGSNGSGRLGHDDGTTDDKPTPTQVKNMTSGVTQVSAGGAHTCAIKNGELWCWGRNKYGQLGDGTTDDKPTPTQVKNMTSGVTQVSVGYHHICAIKSGGLWCWGRSDYGQLGDGTGTTRLVPTSIMDSDVTQVSAGNWHTCAIKSGALYCWGANQYGQLGDGNTTNHSVPTLTSVLNESETRTVYAFGTGHSHNCFKIISTEDSDSPDSDLSSIEELYCWGKNNFGQVGDGTRVQKNTITLIEGMSDVKQISAGYEHTCAIKDGALYCWGRSGYGALGDGTTTNKLTPTLVPTMTSGVTQVSARFYHTCAIKDGELYCWGRNKYGQLGDVTTTDKLTPTPVTDMTSGVTQVSAGTEHNCAIKSGALYCWGANWNGALGDGTTTNKLTPTPVKDMTSGVTQVSAGAWHTCAIKDGALFCWGSNYLAQLGDGTTTNKLTPTPVKDMTSGVKQISAGYEHTCAIKDGALYCWGSNGSGRLGDGTTTNKLTPTPVKDMTSGVTQVSAGAWHTCTVAEDEALYCWGTNHVGQLAQEPSKLALSKVPMLIEGEVCLGDPEKYVSSLDWFYDLSPFTRTSWDFIVTVPPTTPQDRTLILNGTSSDPAGAGFDFYVRALFGNCIVESSATFVTGFFACDKFTIEQRTTPLRIIGTVVTSQLEVHPSALKHGVVWSSIWHPQALYELRKHLILSKDEEDRYEQVKDEATGTTRTKIIRKRSCDNDKNYLANPIHPDNRKESMNCNPVVLRDLADPFSWTTVDPDCAIADDTKQDANCKFYDRKYLSRPISETGIVE